MLFTRSELARWGLFILFINVALTAWTTYTRPILDYDGILYITAAKAIANGDFGLSSELYKGSFYPYLIHLSQKLSSLPYEASAHLLNSIFFTLISIAFTLIIRLLGGDNKKVVAISLAVILLFPSLLKYRPDIFREFGFLCCYLWSIYFAIKFYQSKQKLNLLYWASCLSVGILFRIESAILLIFLSTLLLLQKASLKSINKNLLLKLAGFVVFLIVCVLASRTFLIANSSYADSITYPLEYIKRALQILNTKLTSNNNGITGVATTIYESVLDVLYIIVQRLEVIYALLAVAAYKMRLVLNETYQRQIIGAYLLVCFFILILFDMSLDYLTSRYALTFVLTLLLLVPFSLEKAVDIFEEKNLIYKSCISLLFFILCFSSVKRLYFSDRHIELSSGKWITRNLAGDAKVVSNNSKILYYAQRFPYLTFHQDHSHHRFNTDNFLSKRNQLALDSAEYVALMVRPRLEFDLEQEKIFTTKFGKPIKQIYQDNGLHVNIYKTSLVSN